MLPQNHFAIAAVVTLVAVVLFYPTLDLRETVVWVMVAGMVAAFIDLDVIILVRVKSRQDPELGPWSSPGAVLRDFPGFLGMLKGKGHLRTIAWTHLSSAVAATLVGYLLVPSLFIPLFIGAWSHIATDVQYLRG